MKNNPLPTMIRWLVIIVMPFLLAIITMRGLIAWDWPSYPEFEYGRIQPDVFGFSNQERLELADATMAYLRQPQPATETIHMLQELRLPDSDQSLYNEAEIGHMFDVKVVADAFRKAIWPLALIVIGGLAFLLARSETRHLGYKTLMQAGLLTMSILVAIGLLMGVAWNFVFVQFHQLLFPAGNWTFSYSDSLIRLFPEQFWFDFGVIWVMGILLAGGVLAAIGYFLQRRHHAPQRISK